MKLLSNLFAAVVISVLPGLTFAEEPAKAPEQIQKNLQLQLNPELQSVPAKPAETTKIQQTVKVGYADMAKISAESSLGKASQAQAKAKQEKLQGQLQSRRKQLDKQKATIEAAIATLSPAQREAKAKDFQKKVESFQKFAANAEKEFQALQEGLGKAFNEAIEQAAVEYGKANNLALVVVKRELLYVASGVDAQDVSDGMIRLMNEKWTKK